MKQSFIKRLNEIRSKTNEKKEDQTYITKKQTEFEKLYDISAEKRFQDLEHPEYIAASPTKKPKNDEYEIPDLDKIDEKDEEHKEGDVDEDDPDWEYFEEEGEGDEEDKIEDEKPKKRKCYFHYSRTTAAGVRFGFSTRAICILIWAMLMGKKI